MKRFGATTGQVVAMVSAGALVCAASLWAFVGRSGSSDQDGSGLPANLSLAALTKQAENDPGSIRRTYRETMDREDLTDEQRQLARRNMRRVWQGRLDKNVEEYFAASKEEKQAVLDRQIDEFQKRREEWEQRREERRRQREAEGRDGDRDESPRERYRDRARSMTREQRKQQSESRDPDRMGRRMAYFSAIRKRMQERGIEMSFGPRGRRGSSHN